MQNEELKNMIERYFLALENKNEYEITTFYTKDQKKSNWKHIEPIGVRLHHIPTGIVVECDKFNLWQNRNDCIQQFLNILLTGVSDGKNI